MIAASRNLAEEIRRAALAFGADLAGLVSREDLQEAPSRCRAEARGTYTVPPGWEEDRVAGDQRDRFAWAPSLLVSALHHPADEPALDHHRDPYRGKTEGNRRLIDLNRRLIDWLDESEGIAAENVPYAVEKGGVFLKDAAVLAGLGTVGRNNLLVTPAFGPRVRLRALALAVRLPPGEPLDFDPCRNCDMPCRRACPRDALAAPAAPEEGLLPARDGAYRLSHCDREMRADREAAWTLPGEGATEAMRVIVHCRACELACPVGR